MLLIFDEVQTGMGRTGKLYAYELAGVAPDILTSAKGIGGGFPMAACLATADAAKGLTIGVHGSTFGGNPLAMAIGNAVLDVVLAPGFLDNVARLGLAARQKLAALKDAHPRIIEEVRGEGLMIGLKLTIPPADFAMLARAHKLLTIPAGDNTVRIVPPLVVDEAELAEGVRRLDAACARRRDGLGRRSAGGRSMTSTNGAPVRHFLDLLELPPRDLRGILDASAALKATRGNGARPLAGKTLAMIFERPSTRTRVSFDVAMRQLGGGTIMLTGAEMQLGRGETIADTARVLSAMSTRS